MSITGRYYVCLNFRGTVFLNESALTSLDFIKLLLRKRLLQTAQLHQWIIQNNALNNLPFCADPISSKSLFRLVKNWSFANTT